MTRFARADSIILAILAALMLATRPHPLDQYFHVPDTAWASFFVLGYFVRNKLAFPALFGLAFGIDVVVIYLLGGSGFCFTPAYGMLLPAYGTMWLAGRFAARKLEPKAGSLPGFAILATAAAFVAHGFSSGGYYLLSGRFDHPTLAEFAGRVEQYFPGNLLSMWVWLGIAAAGRMVWTMAGGQLPSAARK
ncbi:hypothetical protein [Novosphingobium aquimarinum]|uniref:hypothetical protein n=1 Tax=Novosphingobium aquimarinum TaxID=2682494 RepID=UPI0012EB896A|nr:hypothetical protein [Novosphingobium aquimarinum]